MSQGFAVDLSREQECKKRNGKRAREQLQNLGSKQDAVVQGRQGYKDNVNLSGVTGAPAAARSSSDWQIESEKDGVFLLVCGEIYNNYMYVILPQI